MTLYCPILLVVITAGLFHTAVSLVFTSTPGDQVAIVGYNISNIELIWRLDLAGKTFDRAKIIESPTSSFDGITPLYFSARSPPILAEYQDRVNVTLVVDSGTVTLTLVIYLIHNVTQSDKIYYRAEVEDSLGARKGNDLFINFYVFPRVHLYSDQTTYYENQTITLHCNATGKPTPTISWKQMNHPSQSFPRGSNLIITTANETDGGEYKCIGTNSVGSDEASVNITVIPFSVPVIEFLSSNQADVIGSTIYLHCNASGFPSPTITWTKQGNDSILSTSSNLTLNQATLEDAGLYTCTATNHEGNDTRTVFVDVQFAPGISRQPQSMIVNESNSISLFCNASGNPSPKITWTKEGDANFKSTNNFLQLTNVSKSDGGIYICTASNGIGQNATANATVTIQYKPQGTDIQSNLTNNLVVRPEGVKLNCTADANPAPNLYEFVSNNNKVGESSNGIFELSSANLSFQNTIKCIPYNQYWVGQAAVLVIIVHVEPEIVTSPLSGVYNESTSVSLFCNATGNPSPNITWTKAGDSLFTHTGNTLTMINVWKNNTGTYVCTASNGVGNADTRNSSVIVQYAPVETVLGSNTTNNTIARPGVISFNCSTDSHPRPLSYEFFKDNTSVESNTDGIFVISSESLSYQASFSCVPKNVLGPGQKAELDVTVYVAPKIASHTKNITITEGDSTVLFCNASGNPLPEISWKKIPGFISSGKELELINATKENSGTYVCTTSNGIGDDASVSILVTVLFSPAIVHISPNQSVIETKSITLFCNASGNPIPNITWTKIDDSGFRYDGSKLTINDTSKNNTGVYRCTASNGIRGTASSSTSLTVQYTPRSTTLQVNVSNSIAIHPDKVDFLCETDANPPATSFQFYHNGQLEANESTGVYVLQQTKISDSGTYSCVPKNLLGNGEKAELNLTIHLRPKIISMTSNQTVSEGANVSMFCNASGVPAPSITWKLAGQFDFQHRGESLLLPNVSSIDSGTYICEASNGVLKPANQTANVVVLYKPRNTSASTNVINNEVMAGTGVVLKCSADALPPTNRYTFFHNGILRHNSSSSQLVIAQTSSSDTGTYSCTPYNHLGGGHVAHVYLNVLVPVAIRFSSSNQTVTEGDDLRLYCNATGNPSPNITWTKVDSHQIVSVNGTCKLNSIKRSDIGFFRCKAENGITTANELVYINVRYEPNITRATSAAETWMNKEVMIQCTAEGNPRPNITWSRGSGTVGIIDTYTVQSTLRINPTTISDFGVYTCTANNGVGTALKHISLTRQLVPGTPIIQKTELVENKMTVRWTAPLNNGGHEIRSYEVSLYDGSGTKTCRTAANRTSCVFDTVLTLKEYSVSIKCENGVGFSNEVKVNMEVKRINMVFPAEPCDVETTTPGGKRYKEIVDAFLAEIDRVYSKSSTKLYGLSVDSLRCGSIIAVFKMSFLKNDTNYLEPLKKETANGKLGTFTVDKDSIKEYEEPVEEAGFTKFWNSLPLGAKIGLIIAFVLFIFLIVYMIVMCVIKCRQNKKSGNFGDDFAMKNYSNRAFSTDTENGLVMTKEKELQYADLAEFRNNNTQGEKLNKPTTNQPTDYAEITHFQKPPQEENNRQNGHSRQDMQTGEKRTDKNEAGSGKTTNNTAKPAYNMETISNDPGIKNNTYIPRARRWHNDDFLY